MAVLRYARQAEFDIEDIASYTLVSWGIEQADRYVTALRLVCEGLATSPLLGRPCSEPHEFPRRIEHGKHVIFYQPEQRGVLIVRVLHERMMAHLRLTQ